jgi:hypothetical protein
MSENEAVGVEQSEAQQIVSRIVDLFKRAQEKIAASHRPDTPAGRVATDLRRATQDTKAETREVLEACSTGTLLSAKYKDAACVTCEDALKGLAPKQAALTAGLEEAIFVRDTMGDPTSSDGTSPTLNGRIYSAQGIMKQLIPQARAFAKRNMATHCTPSLPGM